MNPFEKLLAGVALFLFLLFSDVMVGTVVHTSLPDEKIDDVVKVFLHEPRHYSFLCKMPDSNELILRDFRNISPRIFRDVPSNKNMYVELRGIWKNIDGMHYNSVTIHIHAVSGIEGAGWDHGKFGRGQTQVIE